MKKISLVRRFSVLLLLCFSLLAFVSIPSANAAADMAIGQMVWVRGVVKAVSATGASRDLQRRSPIYEKDTIQTDTTSTAEIAFNDSSVVALRSATTFKIDQYKYDAASPKNGKYVANVVEGGFRTITGIISHSNPDNYQVNTPVATIGVRGTDYSVFYSLKAGLSVKLSKGSIIVANALGQVELDVAKNRIYAAIADLRHPPVVTPTQSPVFKSQPDITPVSSLTQPVGGAAGTTTNNLTGTGIGSTDVGTGQNVDVPSNNSSGATKSVSGFCIN